MQDLFQGSGDLRATPDRFNPAISGALAFFYQPPQLFLIGLRDKVQWVLQPKPGDDINISGIFLVKQRMNTVHHHIEFRPVIAIFFGDTPVKIQHLPANPHTQR